MQWGDEGRDTRVESARLLGFAISAGRNAVCWSVRGEAAADIVDQPGLPQTSDIPPPGGHRVGDPPDEVVHVLERALCAIVVDKLRQKVESRMSGVPVTVVPQLLTTT